MFFLVVSGGNGRWPDEETYIQSESDAEEAHDDGKERVLIDGEVIVLDP